jgi:hypothetical protein
LIVNIAGPITAECGVENETVVDEVRVDIAVTLEVGGWSPKVLGIGFLGRDAGGNGTAGEEPHADVLIGPFHGVDTASLSIETISIGV